MLVAGAPAGDERSDVEVRVLKPTHRLVHRLQRLFEVVAASAGGAQGAQGRGAETRRGRAGTGGVGDREPGAVSVLDEVEPVFRTRHGRDATGRGGRTVTLKIYELRDNLDATVRSSVPLPRGRRATPGGTSKTPRIPR